jgi:hypothetical protein
MIHEDEGFCHFFLWIHQSPLKTSAKAVITVIHCRKKIAGILYHAPVLQAAQKCCTERDNTDAGRHVDTVTAKVVHPIRRLLQIREILSDFRWPKRGGQVKETQYRQVLPNKQVRRR